MKVSRRTQRLQNLLEQEKSRGGISAPLVEEMLLIQIEMSKLLDHLIPDMQDDA